MIQHLALLWSQSTKWEPRAARCGAILLAAFFGGVKQRNSHTQSPCKDCGTSPMFSPCHTALARGFVLRHFSVTPLGLLQSIFLTPGPAHG